MVQQVSTSVAAAVSETCGGKAALILAQGPVATQGFSLRKAGELKRLVH